MHTNAVQFAALLKAARAKVKEAQADLEAIERARHFQHQLLATLRNGRAANGIPTDEASEDQDEDAEDADDSEPSPSLPVPTRTRRGDLMKAVKAFVASAKGRFTMLEVHAAITNAGKIVAKKQSVKVTLASLEKKGKIRTVTRGTGRNPSIYEKMA
jgi:hypothetical protein